MKPRIEFDSENSYNKNIDFDIEVARDDEVKLVGVGRQALGGDGKTSQYTLDYIGESFDLDLNWQETDIYNKVFFWCINFALGGDSFKYYPDQTDLTRFYTCKIAGNNKSFDPQRAHPAVVEFRYLFKVHIVAVSAAITADRAAYYP